MQPQFLVIDDNRDGRCVVARAVQRKFHEAPVHEFASFGAAEMALENLGTSPGPWIVVTGQTADHASPALVAAVRAANSNVPIISLGHNEAEPALASGATHYLEYEAWLLLGGLIDRMTAAWKAKRAP